MIVRIWGTRGSYPVAHRHMLRYGGNTSCVEVRVGNSVIILDAGTGLRLLGKRLMGEPDTILNQMYMLVTHTHWDHIIGFPFFEPLYRSNTHLSIYGLQRTQDSLRTTFARAVSDPLLPVGMEGLHAYLNFYEINHDLCFELCSDVRVSTAQANHPYRALAYRIESPDGMLVYIPDTGPFHTVLFSDERVVWNGATTVQNAEDAQTLRQMRDDIIRLAEGADWLIYDSQFTPAQYMRFPHWGHSTAGHALEIACAAHVQTLLLFHHDPHRTDSELDCIQAELQAIAPPGTKVYAAYEGMELTRESRQ